MKRNFLMVFYCLVTSACAFAQTSTELFETESHGSSSFTDNGVIFNILSHTSTFDIQANFTGTGWSGTANDNRYIDNSASATAGSSFTIRTTSNFFRVNRFWVFLSNNSLNQNVTGTLTVTGRKAGVTQFAGTKSTGFATGLGTTNGHTLIDLTNLNGQNYSNIVIDEIRITTGGSYSYMGLDAFTWVKDAAVLPVTFGKISAGIKDNTLNVNWQTEQETNNDHFEIEASKDGVRFTTIATVKSSAVNGNSDEKITYEWSSTSILSLSMLPVMALLMASFVFARRKLKWSLVAAVAVMAIITISCNKNAEEMSTTDHLLIRIAQVDKDGSKTYSKTIRATHQ